MNQPIYAISAVRYTGVRSRIFRMRMHVVRGSEVSPGIEATRTQVIGAMMAGRTFMVATQGEAQVAAPIYLVHAEGSLVLRTDRDEEPQDWLEGASEI